MKDKILIIGSDGYLGSRLVPFLSSHGCICTCIDTGFFQNGLIHNVASKNSIKKDARAIVEEDLSGFDVVILLAGISNDPFGKLTSEQIYDPSRDYALKIAQMCKNLGILFIFPSSCSVYGAASNSFLDENSAVNPQTPYSINKVQVEKGLKLLAGDDFSPIALRFGTVYGLSPRIRFDVVINMLCGLALTTGKITLNSDGQAWRPHLHIEDACRAFYSCIKTKPKTGKFILYNVGQDIDNHRIIDIANLVKKQVEGSILNFLGVKEKFSNDDLIRDRKIQDGVDTRTYKVSFNKIHQELTDFSCAWTVESGIRDLVKTLKNIPLDKSLFNKREFYRLQQIEYLHKSGKINDDLFWMK